MKHKIATWLYLQAKLYSLCYFLGGVLKIATINPILSLSIVWDLYLNSTLIAITIYCFTFSYRKIRKKENNEYTRIGFLIINYHFSYVIQGKFHGFPYYIRIPFVLEFISYLLGYFILGHLVITLFI